MTWSILCKQMTRTRFCNSVSYGSVFRLWRYYFSVIISWVSFKTYCNVTICVPCLIHNNMHADHAYIFVHNKGQRFSLAQYPVAFSQFNSISRVVLTILKRTAFSISDSAEEKNILPFANAKVQAIQRMCAIHSMAFLFVPCCIKRFVLMYYISRLWSQA